MASPTTQSFSLPMSMKVRFLYDIGMFIVFMTLYSVYSPFIATYALLGLSTLKMGAVLYKEREPKLFDWVEFGFLTAFCVATLAFHAALFIQIKAPILGSLFAFGMMGYMVFKKESFMKALFAKDFKFPDMPDEAWKKIDYMMITNLLIKAAIVFTLVFAVSEAAWYYSNFLLPILDFTMLGSMYLVAKPHFDAADSEIPMKNLPATDLCKNDTKLISDASVELLSEAKNQNEILTNLKTAMENDLPEEATEAIFDQYRIEAVKQLASEHKEHTFLRAYHLQIKKPLFGNREIKFIPLAGHVQPRFI